ncbi:MAG: PucR family transcriptional regulator ligand-binding domain-containing protein [Acidimicrobiales bacterium]
MELVNARHVNQVPGRKTDVGDAAWLARLAELGLLRGSFAPPREIRELRDLTRYEKRLIEDRTREGQRVEKVLEDTGIKMQAVASKTLGVSGPAMLDALIAGERDPEVLADVAKGRRRNKIDDLVRALRGEVGAHHLEMLRLHLDHIDDLTEAIARLDDRIESGGKHRSGKTRQDRRRCVRGGHARRAGRAGRRGSAGSDNSGGMWRTFDVGAVVESLPFRNASVAAGADGVARRVSRASLAATPEHLRRVGANELVLTTATTLLGTGEGGERLVARLDAAQVAGVAVRLDGPDRLPPEVLVAAERLSLPLITFPEDSALADVTAAVLDALLDAQRQRLERVLDIHQRFTRIVLAGGGAAEIAATLNDLLGCPVAVLDTDGRPTVAVPADAAGDLDLATTAGVRRPIRAGGHDYGAVVALTGGALDQDGQVALERAADSVAVRLAQARAVAEAQERFAAISLEELVAGHAGDPAEVTERAISFGWDLGRPRAVLLASIDPPEEGTIPPAALNTIAAAARATLGRDAIVWTRSATIAALLAPDTEHPAERRRLAEGLRTELDQRLRSATVSIGVGRRVDTPAELPRSFVEASRAVDVGRWAKGRHVTELFDELGLERLLAATPTDDLAEFVQRTIGPLVEHDRANHTDLVDTLAVWLETRNMAEAARRMHVHYNTLKNRLERIEATIGPVVTDATRSLECEVAIHVERHYDVPWGDRP